MTTQFRIEKDSMGEVKVPLDALYQAQTQRAVENFPISGLTIGPIVIRALGIIKKCAAQANQELGLIKPEVSQFIQAAAQEVIEGKWDKQFPIDIFQTGSGTSSNMNANEVVASRANQLVAEKKVDLKIHPNDHVNFGQSSNDVYPTALRIAARIAIETNLLPGMEELKNELNSIANKYAGIAKTGKTHLMDAMPVTFKQVFGAHAHMVAMGMARVKSSVERLSELPQGGTAVGTGINTHQDFGKLFAKYVSKTTGFEFQEAVDHFEAQATLDAPAEMSAQLKTFACSLMKIANDFRWMNSGPNSGVAEIEIAPLQPGSSIMPGKVNPVIEESAAMVCAQVIGNDAAITIGAQSGNFELNVMVPVVAQNLIQSITLLGNSCRNFARMSVSKVKINEKNVQDKLYKNPILVTALNPIIGYDLAAKIAKKSYAENRSLLDVAKEMTTLTDEQLKAALDPMKMTKGGFTE
jgi:fumarate hydratase class II